MGDSERDRIAAKYPGIWRYETVAWYAFSAQVAGTEPVHRFWSDKLGKHFYIIGDSERDRIAAKYVGIWRYETVAWYAYPTQVDETEPVGRFWSNQFVGHFYTITQSEIDRIAAKYPGVWNYETVAYYAFTSVSGGKSTRSLAPLLNLVSRELEVPLSEFPATDGEASVVHDAILPDFDVVYPLAYPDSQVSVQAYESVADAWQCVLDSTNSPNTVALKSVKLGRSYLLEVFVSNPEDRELACVRRSWFDSQLDPPDLSFDEDVPFADTADTADMGTPTLRMRMPQGANTQTIKLYSSKDGVVQSVEAVAGGDTVELVLPEWNGWYWVGGWRDSDTTLVLSIWMRINAEN